MPVKRIARFVETDIVGQFDRQVGCGHRHDAAVFAMNDRNGAAPVTLPGNTPVAQSEVYFPAALIGGLDAVGDLSLGAIDIQPIKEVRIGEPARSGIRLVFDSKIFCVFRDNDRQYVQPVFAGKIEISLVVGGGNRK